MNDIQQSLKQLDHIIKQEIQAYQQLSECLDTEKQLLVKRQLKHFVNNLYQKEMLTGKIARLEQTRQRLTTSLASCFHLPNHDLTLRRLSTLTQAPYANRFADYRTQLKILLNRLQKQNQENERLLTASLTIVNEALAFFASLGVATPTYCSSGDFSSQAQGRLLSQRV